MAELLGAMGGGAGGLGGASAGGLGPANPYFGMAALLSGVGLALPPGMINPMGKGRPYIPGMDVNYVTDLMNGDPGPVPMDIAREAAVMRGMGRTPDQISDILGDRMQARAAAARMAAAMAMMQGTGGGGGARGQGRRRGRNRGGARGGAGGGAHV